MNTLRKSLLIGLLLGAALLFGIIKNNSANASQPYKPQPSPTPEILENGWFRFTDPDAGYSIDYPSNSSLSVSNDIALEYKHVTIIFPTLNGSDYHTMQIIVYANSERLPFKRIVEDKVYQGKSPKKGDDIPLTPIKVSGFDAVKMVMSPFDPAVFISAKSKIYFISLPYDMLSGNPPTAEAIEVFNQILNTFLVK